MGFSDILFSNIYNLLREYREYYDSHEVELCEIELLVEHVANALIIVHKGDRVIDAPPDTYSNKKIWFDNARKLIRDFEESERD